MFAQLISPHRLFVLTSIALLASCGGGGGGGGGGGSPATFTISVNVSGLKGNVVLQNNGGDSLPVPSDGTYPFTNKAAGYNVTVATQPLSGQTCTVANGSGTATANVSNINVSCTPNTASRYVFVANALDNSISTYVIDNTSGRPKYINKLNISTTPLSITVDPSGTHAYVLSSGNSNIAQYHIGLNGALASMTPSTVTAGANPAAIAIDPLGRFAYIANTNSNDVSAYTIAHDTGALTPIDCVSGTACNALNFKAGTNPKYIAIDPSGKFAYAVNYGSADISAYTINQSTGALTQIDCGSGTGCHIKNFVAGVYPQHMTIDPTGQYAYVVNNYNGVGGNSISQYNINATTGALSLMTHPAVATDINPFAITLDSTGKYAYVTNSFNGTGGNSISQYTVDATTGALSAMATATVATGIAPQAIIADRLGKTIYVTNTGSNTVSIYNIGSMGALAPAAPATLPTFSYPLAMGLVVGNTAAQAVPQYAYAVNHGVANTGTNSSITPYTINATNGQLTPLANSPSGVAPSAMVFDPTGKYAYVANTGDSSTSTQNVSQYKVNADGSLTPLNPATVSVPLAVNPYAIAIDPLGRYVYVTNASGNLSQFKINANGTLSSMSPALVTTDAGPSSIAVDPSGQYVYVTNRDSGSTVNPITPYKISQYAIDTTIGTPSSGTLSPMSPATVTGSAEPNAISIDASGQYAYVANRGGATVNGSISQFKISSINGALTSSGSDLPIGKSPLSITVDGMGRVYVTNYGGNTLYQYTTSSGVLASAPATITTGSGPYSVTVDATGKYAYVANEGSNNISQYIIGTTLSANGTASAGTAPRCIVTTSTWQ